MFRGDRRLEAGLRLPGVPGHAEPGNAVKRARHPLPRPDDDRDRMIAARERLSALQADELDGLDDLLAPAAVSARTNGDVEEAPQHGSPQRRLRGRILEKRSMAPPSPPEFDLTPPSVAVPLADVASPIAAAPSSNEANLPGPDVPVPPSSECDGPVNPTQSSLRSPLAGARRLLAGLAGSSRAPRLPEPAFADGAASPAGRQPSLAKAELAQALLASRRAFLAAGVFSLVINVLMLAGPLFMLQVYDRVLTSGSVPTLVVLSIMTAAAYAIIGFLELVRSRIVSRIGAEVDGRIGDRVFEASLRRSVRSQGTSPPALRELDSLRQFLASQGPLTLFDAPWTPIYLGAIFMLHWTLGVAATLGAGMLLAIAVLSEVRSRGPQLESGRAAFRSLELAETGQRNAESILAMGMLGAYRARWQQANRESLAWQILAADRLGSMSALSKSLRLLLQSLMLAVGAALAINGLISAGAIVASTIILGRALAPVEQAIGHWRQLLKARESYGKLGELLRQQPVPPARTALPAPKGELQVSALGIASPDGRQPIVSGVGFAVRAGQMLAVVGPSASGKSSLARVLVGIWPAAMGEVRIDGARIDQWSPEELGRHIGYLPQSVELFAGTVAENIARFNPAASDADIVAAATEAHAHEMILGLEQGYQTQLGAFGNHLSAGQRQRIGLARALFGAPSLVVLDEPNSNLDRAGDEALALALDGCRQRGQTVVLVSHRMQAVARADLLLVLERGGQRTSGPRDAVLKVLQGGAPAAPAARKPETPAPRPPQPAVVASISLSGGAPAPLQPMRRGGR